MKKLFFNLVILSCFFYACESDEAPEAGLDGNLEFQGNNAMISSEDLSNLRFKDVPGTIFLDEATPKGQVRIEATDELNEWLSVKKEGGELRIIGKDNVPTSLDMSFYIHPNDIRKIVIEGKNKVEVANTPVLEYLEIVTEGESQLIIHNLKVKNLVSRREGKSQMLLSCQITDFESDSLFFLSNTVQVLDENYIVYQEDGVDYLLFAPEIEIREDSIFALGYDINDPINSFFITHTHDLRNEGESILDALELPTYSVTSKNEGKSESKIWAIQHLNVRGEGESSMYYLGNPVVDQNLEGFSSLNKIL